MTQMTSRYVSITVSCKQRFLLLFKHGLY